jgi:hypothetical protein
MTHHGQEMSETKSILIGVAIASPAVGSLSTHIGDLEPDTQLAGTIEL